jgi:hypothetical protein
MRNVVRISVLVGVLSALALFAASIGTAGTPTGSAEQQAGSTPENVHVVNVNFVINRFVRQGRRIVAQGAVIATDTSATTTPAVVRKAFTAAISAKRGTYASASRICDVLTLNLGPLHLELLGLVIDLSRVVLTIKADSNGGLLGRLFCGIAGRSSASAAQLGTAAKKMTKAARANGLNQGVAGFQAQVAPGYTQAPGTVCSILDLMLGPLDLNVLGLLVHLDRLRLTITAVRGGGILGDLLCGLAGGTPAALPSARGAARSV